MYDKIILFEFNRVYQIYIIEDFDKIKEIFSSDYLKIYIQN
jgi:hypothetical protein